MLGSAGAKGQPARPWQAVIFELSPPFKSCRASQLGGGVSGKRERCRRSRRGLENSEGTRGSFCSLQTWWNSISTCTPSPAAPSTCLPKWPGFLLISSMSTFLLVSKRKFEMWLHTWLLPACLWPLSSASAYNMWNRANVDSCFDGPFIVLGLFKTDFHCCSEFVAANLNWLVDALSSPHVCRSCELKSLHFECVVQAMNIKKVRLWTVILYGHMNPHSSCGVRSSYLTQIR